MRRQERKYRAGRFFFSALLLAGIRFAACPQPANATENVSNAGQTNEHHVLSLTRNEFSILNLSEMDGLLKYGGSGDFKISMAKVENEVVWTVTIDNPRLMELLGIFVGESAMKLLQSLDPDKIEASQKLHLAAFKSLSQKLDYAQKNPLWDSIKLSGKVTQKGADWMLQTKDGEFKLTGDKLADLKSQRGKGIVADGVVKIPGAFEVTQFMDKRENTLEMFVMSFCPFAQRAESKLLEFLAKSNAVPKSALEIHYLFYKQQTDGAESFVSMHGEEEIVEDLVQITIRDRFPHYFQAYLQLRTENGKTPWLKLAGQLGATAAETDEITKQITTRREEMIRREYEYAVKRYGITDGSPSYVWESERAMDLGKIEAFKGLSSMTGEACAH